MSEDFSPAISARALDLQAATWLEERDRGHWTADDQLQFDVWLSASPMHEIAYLRMEAAWVRTERLVALVPSGPRSWKTVAFSRAAAAILVVVFAVAAGFWFYFSKPQGVVYATGVGGREIITLADGSRIELNTDTTIRLSADINSRKVWLQKGEAFFKVTHDASRPFVVIAGKRRVTDLGTQFSVRQENDLLEVSVVEGRVSLDADKQDARSVILLGGERAFATSTGISVKTKSAKAMSDALGWRRGVLVFDGTPLADAAREINRYSTVKILVGSARAGRVIITGTISATDPEEFVAMTQNVFGLHGKHTPDGIVISN